MKIVPSYLGSHQPTQLHTLLGSHKIPINKNTSTSKMNRKQLVVVLVQDPPKLKNAATLKPLYRGEDLRRGDAVMSSFNSQKYILHRYSFTSPRYRCLGLRIWTFDASSLQFGCTIMQSHYIIFLKMIADKSDQKIYGLLLWLSSRQHTELIQTNTTPTDKNESQMTMRARKRTGLLTHHCPDILQSQHCQTNLVH